ncbi:MAG TPA: carboxypeptidase-like regulatory domain-containing protein [Acidobacteriaceae bacterium]
MNVRALGPNCAGKSSFSSSLDRLLCALIFGGVIATVAPAQTPATGAQTATINGTVIDINDNAVPDATILVDDSTHVDHRSVVADKNGFFAVGNLHPGASYQVTVTQSGFSNWTSPFTVLKPGQYLELTGIRLHIAAVETTVTAIYSPEQMAIQQVEIAETQRVLGIVPNFYVVYDSANAVPLTSKLKFKLAIRSSFDPITLVGVGMLAGINQAADRPDYVQGAKGYGQRVGAGAAIGFTNIMIGGAILPSLLHQDPRYFYQGTGTKKSRTLRALSTPFICKGDNGHWQPNYSSVGGDLASGAISNAYYPETNRGPGLVFGNALIGAGGRMVNGLIQEFVLRKLTPNARVQN